MGDAQSPFAHGPLFQVDSKKFLRRMIEIKSRIQDWIIISAFLWILSEDFINTYLNYYE